MRLKDLAGSLGDFWREYRKMKSGIVGLAILLLFLLAAVFANFLVPYPDALENWHNISYWQDEPLSAPPVWANLFSAEKGTVSQRTTGAASDFEEEVTVTDVETQADGSELEVERKLPVARTRWDFSYRWDYDIAPKDLVLRWSAAISGNLRIEAQRPDGETFILFEDDASRLPSRFSVSNDGRRSLFEKVGFYEDSTAMSLLDESSIKPLGILFGKADVGMATKAAPLKGDYRISIIAERVDDKGAATMGVVGSVSGALGTDSSKRDIFTGLLLGMQWALIIGLLTSLFTVIVGVFFGVISAYFGGWIDSLMQRVGEFFQLMPVIPFIIVLAAIFKPNIWIIIGIMVVFFWVGPVKTVRSMALQIREETYVEASKALGSGSWRIIFRHIVPILMPYSFASMALSVPGVIIYEATISLIGLGDPSIVTWGQILHDAAIGNAVNGNLWWWVVPPGLMIALLGMSFAFIGTAMDKILHPKLKTR